MNMDRIRIGDVMIGVALFAFVFQVYRGATPFGEATAAALASVASVGFILSRYVRSD